MGLLSIPADEFSAALDALVVLQAEPDDAAARAQCIGRITPVIRQLRHGKVLEQQLHKLIAAGNPERAHKLLKVVGPGKKFLGIF